MRDKKEVIRGGYGPRTTALGLAQNTSYTTCEFLAQSEVTLGGWAVGPNSYSQTVQTQRGEEKSRSSSASQRAPAPQSDLAT